MLSDSERTLRARIASYESWSRTPDRTARTQAARDAFRDSFLTKVDPNGELSLEERQKRADAARKAHYARVAFKSVQARRRRANKTATPTARSAAVLEGIDGGSSTDDLPASA